MKKKGGMLALIVILMFQGIFGTGLGTFNGQRVSAAGAGNPDPGNGVSVTNASRKQERAIQHRSNSEDWHLYLQASS